MVAVTEAVAVVTRPLPETSGDMAVFAVATAGAAMASWDGDEWWGGLSGTGWWVVMAGSMEAGRRSKAGGLVAWVLETTRVSVPAGAHQCDSGSVFEPNFLYLGPDVSVP